MLPGDFPPWQAVEQQAKRKVHVAVDTLCHLLALLVTPANEQERAEVGELEADSAGQAESAHNDLQALIDK